MTGLNHDAIVVGAGPAGLLAAGVIGRNGHDVTVLEEHKNVGEPDHCAGLLSLSGLRSLGLQPPEDVIQNTVHAARIYSPSGNSLLIERGQREAVVVDRRRFDSWLADRAVDQGAIVATNAQVQSLKLESGQVAGVLAHQEGAMKEHRAAVVIDAEGVVCRLSKSVGLPTVPKSSKYPAYQYEMRGVEADEDIVEMYYGRQVAPGFFAWMIPLGEGRARVGLAANHAAKMRLGAAIQHHPILSKKLAKASVERGWGGTVLVGMPVRKTYMSGIMVVGDAAGMVKATTGGGVIMGGTTGTIAGRVASLAISEKDYSERCLRQYQRGWRSLLIKNLRSMYLAQKAMSLLSDHGLDSLVRGTNESGLLNVVEREGDMDMQWRTIRRVLTDPRTFRLGLRLVRYLSP
jgi:digeranylgeranylglycerophospholipid reductase